MSKKKVEWTPERTKAFYKVYEEYSKALRTWFVAFGIGGPVLFLTQQDVSNKIVESGNARTIVLLFLIGVSSIFVVIIKRRK